MMTLNLHNVTRTELTPARDLPNTGSYVRDLIVTLADGQTFTVTLFADDRESLLVKG